MGECFSGWGSEKHYISTDHFFSEQSLIMTRSICSVKFITINTKHPLYKFQIKSPLSFQCTETIDHFAFTEKHLHEHAVEILQVLNTHLKSFYCIILMLNFKTWLVKLLWEYDLTPMISGTTTLVHELWMVPLKSNWVSIQVGMEYWSDQWQNIKVVWICLDWSNSIADSDFQVIKYWCFVSFSTHLAKSKYPKH